jgi:soluble lytic murein transglycosylase-like protein
MSIAAYNAGEGAVARHGGIPPYRQTQAYVRKVTALL